MSDFGRGAIPHEAEFLLYRTEDGRARVEVRFDGETAWLTQAAMAELFQTTPQNIGQHVAAIYTEGELDAAATCKQYFQVRREGSRDVRRHVRHYSLPVIIAVGYRVRSTRGTQFRQANREPAGNAGLAEPEGMIGTGGRGPGIFIRMPFFTAPVKMPRMEGRARGSSVAGNATVRSTSGGEFGRSLVAPARWTSY